MTKRLQLAACTPDFESASRAVLQFLHLRLGFDLWMVTRTEGEEWIVLQTEDSGYGVEAGAVFRWADSFCSRMIDGLGPRIAPRSDSVPAYRDAPIGKQVKIGAYVGVPLTLGNGGLFGTLCAIDPAPQPDGITTELPLIELLASMLSALLHAEFEATEATRVAERAVSQLRIDELTGVFNRRGWNELLESEDSRCRRYGNAASVVSVAVDGLKAVNDGYGHAAGDERLCRAAKILLQVTRTSDVVARVTGNEFAVLGVECGPTAAGMLAQRIQVALSTANIPVSIGLASRLPVKGGLLHAWQAAEKLMHLDKSSQSRSDPASMLCGDSFS